MRRADAATSRLWSHPFYKQGNNGRNESSPSDVMSQTLNDSEKLEAPDLETVLESIRLWQLCLHWVNDLQTIVSISELLKKFALGFPVIDTSWQSPRSIFQRWFCTEYWWLPESPVRITESHTASLLPIPAVFPPVFTVASTIPPPCKRQFPK